MRAPLLLLPVLLPLLAACGDAYSGSWLGEIPCQDEDFDGALTIALELDRSDDGVTWTGTGQVGFSGSVEMSGAWREYVSTQVLDPVELTVDGETATIDGEVVDCSTTIDGEASDQGCGNDTVHYDVVPDGDGVLRVGEEGDDCQGEILRQ